MGFAIFVICTVLIGPAWYEIIKITKNNEEIKKELDGTRNRVTELEGKLRR